MLKKSGYMVLMLMLCVTFLSCTKEQPKQPEEVVVTEGPAQTDTSPVVAEIGEERITLNQLDRAIERLPLPYQERFKTEEGRKYVLDDLITTVLLSREAERLKLDQKPEIKEQLEGIKKRILSAGLLRAEMAKEPVPGEKESRQYYESHKEQFTEPEKVRMRQIVVRTAEEGQDIIKALREGHDFVQMAKEKSVDPSKANGGYIGWVGRDRMKPDFAETIFKLGKGEFSAPMPTAKGYVIILIEDKKAAIPVDYSKVEPAIIQRLRAEREEKVLGALRTRLFKEMNVTIYEDKLAQSGGRNQEAK
ncbi:MAG: peptidylprolyl isomerase [Desulfovibrionales bacterium]|nr:peptidylprolyl isomerase [Desulfovibrionales bacterium]